VAEVDGDVPGAGFAAGEFAGVAEGDGEVAGAGFAAGELAGVAAAAGAAEVAGDVPGAGWACGDAGEAAGLAAFVLDGGGAFSSSTGARFPTFAKSGPILILPSKTGRSKR
jgi:hypothetical protein